MLSGAAGTSFNASIVRVHLDKRRREAAYISRFSFDNLITRRTLASTMAASDAGVFVLFHSQPPAELKCAWKNQLARAYTESA